MGLRTRAFYLFMVGVMALGCDSVTDSFNAREIIAQQRADLVALENELRASRADLAVLKEKVSDIEFKNLLRDFDTFAYLQPGDSGYSAVRFTLGVLTVQLLDVKPFANSTKVSLRVGNPLASDLNGLAAKIDWGQVNEKGAPNNDTAKSKVVSFTETLRSGAWTTLSVVLDGTMPADLGFIRVSEVSYTGIALRR